MIVEKLGANNAKYFCAPVSIFLRLTNSIHFCFYLH